MLYVTIAYKLLAIENKNCNDDWQINHLIIPAAGI